MFNDTLVVIPARGGSKGIPNKNIRFLGGKPLIHYSIDIARCFFEDENIYLSTDSEKVKKVAEQSGLEVPFLRPGHLATDTSGMYEVMLQALQFYQEQGKEFSKILLLQPTSPFRTKKHLTDIFETYNSDMDMVVSVGIAHYNPYFSLFEELNGWLAKSKQGNFARRQDCPPVYYYNGSLYLININSLKKMTLTEFKRVKKYIMEEKYCLDIDTPLDWLIGEAFIEKGVFGHANC